MTMRVAFTLQINGVVNHKGCIDKVKEALGTLDDVNVLEMDPKIGKYIILTTIATRADALERAIKRAFNKKKIVLSPGINHNLPQFQASATTIALQIYHFCYCDGCMKKINKALGVGKVNDVKLLAMDPKIGLFVILTTRDLDAIQRAIKGPFSKKKIICDHVQLPLPPPLPLPVPQTNVIPSAPPIPQVQIWYRGALQGTVSGFFEDDRLTIYDI